MSGSPCRPPKDPLPPKHRPEFRAFAGVLVTSDKFLYVFGGSCRFRVFRGAIADEGGRA